MKLSQFKQRCSYDGADSNLGAKLYSYFFPLPVVQDYGGRGRSGPGQCLWTLHWTMGQVDMRTLTAYTF